jgi:hypothetical protein
MADQPAYIKNLKSLTRGDPAGLDDIELWESEVYQTGDRTTAVMLGAMLDSSLERLLATLLRSDLNSSDRSKIFEFEGALGSFSSRIVMAYALKLIGPKSRADLDLIRLLRNEFAHSRKSFDFNTPEVKVVCDKLQIPDLPGAYIPHFFRQRVSNDRLVTANDNSNPRTRYIIACHNLAHRMYVARARSDEENLPSDLFTDNPLP